LHGLENLFDKEFADARRFKTMPSNQKMLTDQDRNLIMASTEIDKLRITTNRNDDINNQLITEKLFSPVQELEGRVFNCKRQLEEALAERSVYWRQKKNDNVNSSRGVDCICKIFSAEGDERNVKLQRLERARLMLEYHSADVI
jgi:hypothetical protein